MTTVSKSRWWQRALAFEDLAREWGYPSLHELLSDRDFPRSQKRNIILGLVGGHLLACGILTFIAFAVFSGIERWGFVGFLKASLYIAWHAVSPMD